MKKVFIPLFWKFTMVLTLVVIVFGSLNIWMIYDEVHRSFTTELDNRGVFMANTFAERALKPILYDDYSELYHLTQEMKNIDQSVEYAFYVNATGEVVSHTFHGGVPSGLLDAHKGNKYLNPGIVIVKPFGRSSDLIRDYSVPVLEGKAGTVRIGLKEQSFAATIKTVLTRFLAMVLVFFVLGIAGAFVFSYFITAPIKRISTRARNTNLDTLAETEPPATDDYGEQGWVKHFSFAQDELDILTKHFVEMMQRLRAAHQELKTAQSSLIQSEKMGAVGTLVAGIAHEINNPIAGLQNCITRISKDPLNKEQNEKYLPIMAEATEKVELVVKGLLNFSKKHDYEFTTFEVLPLLENVLLLTAFLFEKSRIMFSKNLPHRHVKAYGSPRHMEQVIMNLTINSIDAIKERRLQEPDMAGQIQFTFTESDGATRFVISDNGCGVNSEQLPHIFDPFFTTKPTGQGTGLGLSICYNTILEHQGNLEAAVNEQGGMDFIITLPNR